MLQEMKSGTVKVAMMLTLAASMIAAGNAQAESVQIPIDTSDSQIQDVVSNSRADSTARDMMNQVRSGVIQSMSSKPADQLPLRNIVQAKMMPMMMARLLPVQLPALSNPNGGIPGNIAPPPF